MKQAHVIGILGTSFCGSSLLNMMLDSHPRIFGAGELHKIFSIDKKAFCSICLNNCAFWDAGDFKKNITRNNIYNNIMDEAGVSTVVDSSKNAGHFKEMNAESGDINFVYIIMKKHPIRLVGSFLGNQFIPKFIGLEEYRESGFSSKPCSEILTAIDDYLIKVRKTYHQIGDLAGGDAFDLKYEDLISQPDRALRPILAGVGLEWDPVIEEYTNLQHHPIGGNAAAHYTVRKQTNPEAQKRREGKMIPEKLAYYQMRQKKPVIDDKYRSTLRDGLENAVRQLASFSEACTELGYREYA